MFEWRIILSLSGSAKKAVWCWSCCNKLKLKNGHNHDPASWWLGTVISHLWITIHIWLIYRDGVTLSGKSAESYDCIFWNTWHVSRRRNAGILRRVNSIRIGSNRWTLWWGRTLLRIPRLDCLWGPSQIVSTTDRIIRSIEERTPASIDQASWHNIEVSIVAIFVCPSNGWTPLFIAIVRTELGEFNDQTKQWKGIYTAPRALKRWKYRVCCSKPDWIDVR
jgi:hypothetical protein